MSATIFENGNIRCKKCRHGLMMYNALDTHIGRSLDLYGEWGESEINIMRLFIKPGDSVFDIGANIGTHSLFMSSMVGPGGCVFSFEPQRIVFQLLCGNMALNGVRNVYASNFAVGASRGAAVIPKVDYARMGNFGGVRLAAEGDGDLVDVIALDNTNIKKCSLIKLDVEGMELSVLQGAAMIVETAKPVILAENNNELKSPSLIQYLKNSGYVLYWQFSSFFTPDNYFGNKSDVFGNIYDVNILCVHPEQTSIVKSLLPVDDNHESPGHALQRYLSSK